jgi:hypothetical protein
MKRLLIAFIALVSLEMALADAPPVPSSFTLDLPLSANIATPAWLGQPEVLTDPNTIELPITPSSAKFPLLVTLFFNDQDGPIRLIWKDAYGNETLLANNFCEGTGVANQRGLLIDPALIKTGGTLEIEGVAEGVQPVTRLNLQWLVRGKDLISPKETQVLVSPDHLMLTNVENLETEKDTAPEINWDKQVVVANLVDSPQHIEQPTEFSVGLNSVPTLARLQLKENGLPLGQHFVLWVNQEKAGVITPVVPELNDLGYFNTQAGGTPTYVGWRTATFMLPTGLLKTGANALQFSPENDDGTPALSATPLVIRDVTIQLLYPEAAPAPPPSPTETDSLPNTPPPSTHTEPPQRDYLSPGAVAGPDSTLP